MSELHRHDNGSVGALCKEAEALQLAGIQVRVVLDKTSGATARHSFDTLKGQYTVIIDARNVSRSNTRMKIVDLGAKGPVGAPGTIELQSEINDLMTPTIDFQGENSGQRGILVWQYRPYSKPFGSAGSLASQNIYPTRDQFRPKSTVSLRLETAGADVAQ